MPTKTLTDVQRQARRAADRAKAAAAAVAALTTSEGWRAWLALRRHFGTGPERQGGAACSRPRCCRSTPVSGSRSTSRSRPWCTSCRTCSCRSSGERRPRVASTQEEPVAAGVTLPEVAGCSRSLRWRAPAVAADDRRLRSQTTLTVYTRATGRARQLAGRRSVRARRSADSASAVPSRLHRALPASRGPRRS